MDSWSICCGLTGLAPIPAHGALGPGQRELEGLEEVEDAPADDDVVVETNEAADLPEEGMGGVSVGGFRLSMTTH